MYLNLYFNHTFSDVIHILKKKERKKIQKVQLEQKVEVVGLRVIWRYLNSSVHFALF